MSDKLLKSTERAGLYFLPPLRRKAIEAAAQKHHFPVLNADIGAHKKIEATLRQLGNALHFPIWFGANFDALFDCLTDPDWYPAKGHVIILSGIDSLRTSDPDDFTTLIEVLQAAAEARREAGSPLWILLDTPARGIAPLPEA
ncbi:MAG: barstar family protein [Rhodocyclaceae bacterium]|nr:barstar family protein [Rhodocyclaceae bacterium]